MKSWFQKFRDKARKIRGQTYTLYLAYRHPATPWYAKVFAALVVAYAFSPIDLIPDFIPVLGYLDDLILVPLGIALALKMIPSEALASAERQAAQQGEGHRQKNWAVGVIIGLIWLLLVALLVTWIGCWVRTLQAL